VDNIPKIVMIHWGEYSSYVEKWFFVFDDSLLQKETLEIIFEEAKHRAKIGRMMFCDQWAKTLIKHGRRDLVDKGRFARGSPIFKTCNVSEELMHALENIEWSKKDWIDYIPEVSQGKMKLIEPDLKFEYSLWSWGN